MDDESSFTGNVEQPVRGLNQGFTAAYHRPIKYSRNIGQNNYLHMWKSQAMWHVCVLDVDLMQGFIE